MTIVELEYPKIERIEGDERFSNVHLVKHFSPLRKSFIPSRRQMRQTGPV